MPTLITSATNEEAAATYKERTGTQWMNANVYVARCVHTIENALIEADWALYSDADKKQRLKSSPALDALNNPIKTDAADLIRAFCEWLLLHGNCYLFNAGTVKRPELYVLPGDRERMQVIPNKQGWPDHYELRINPSTVIRYELDEITHLKLFSLSSSLYGVSVIEALREGLLVGALSQKTRSNFWLNDATPAGILSNDQPVDDMEATRQVKRWVKLFRGPDRSGRTAFLGGGTKYQAVAVPPKDMQWLQQHDVEAKDICVAFGVPMVLLDGMSANRATAQEATRNMWQLTVLPFGGGITSALSRAPWCSGYLDLDTSGVDALKPDAAAERDAASKILITGLISLNRAREMIGEPKLSGTQGDVFYVPKGVVVTPLAMLGVIPDAPAVPAPADDGGKSITTDGKSVGDGDPRAAPAGTDAGADRGARGSAAGIGERRLARTYDAPATGGTVPLAPGPVVSLLDVADRPADGSAFPADGSDPLLGAKQAGALKRHLKREFQRQLDSVLAMIRAAVPTTREPANPAPGALLELCAEGFPAHDQQLLRTHLRAIASAMGQNAPAWATRRAAVLAGELLDTTIADVTELAERATDEGFTDRELQDAVIALFKGYQDSRIETIVETERAAAIAHAKDQP